TTGYSHMIVYTAQALDAKGRFFESANADAIDNASVTLTPAAGHVVIWSNAIDGDDVAAPAGETLSAASINALTTYVGGGGKLLISGTALGEDLVTKGDATSQTFYSNVLQATLVSDNAATNLITPPASYSSLPDFATGPD